MTHRPVPAEAKSCAAPLVVSPEKPKLATKAVFFDWYNTLARYDPPNEALQATACRSFGIVVDSRKLLKGIAEADRYMYQENMNSRVDKRPPNEQVEIYTHYEDIVLKTAGVNVPRGLALPIWMKVRDMAKGSTFMLFDDVLPALDELRKRSLVLGMISNLLQDMMPLVSRLGMVTYVDYVVNPQAAGADKPDLKIFQYALEQARVENSEALYVGDQYDVDVAGAQSAGIRAILLDRYDIHPDIDCPRIQSLMEVAAYL
ncbi:MAG: HAD-IA family hydrolase [Dehalococcoidia bacterium]|nr:HAD-IA family hydrolase [Dehalococcoidia bacterium]